MVNRQTNAVFTFNSFVNSKEVGQDQNIGRETRKLPSQTEQRYFNWFLFMGTEKYTSFRSVLHINPLPAKYPL